MKRQVLCMFLLLTAAVCLAQEFNKIPYSAKWLDKETVIYSFDGTYTDSTAFSINARTLKRTEGVSAPEKFAAFPVNPEGAVNLTYSPDSTKLAFTRGGDLYVVDIASKTETRLTEDGSDLVMNGYASWVYFEEILGRPSRYKAFWWSPDSRKLGFYRFDNTAVPMFPIYSPKGQDGSLSRTRYPKAGEPNPQVRIGMVDVQDPKSIVWADFNPADDQYFGIPFWGADSRSFYIAREPRLQNTLDLYAVSAADGSKTKVYSESYPTWLDWIWEVIFTSKGMYMARSFESGWEQIYFLSYDGKTFRRLTDGTNWRTHLVRVDEKAGKVYFTANRDSDVKAALYEVNSKGVIRALTDPSMDVSSVVFSPDGKYFSAVTSNYTTPPRVKLYKTAAKSSATLVSDAKGPDYDASKYALPQEVRLKLSCGLTVPGNIVYPKNFDPSKKYPVHVSIYGGPDTPTVKDRWVRPNERNQWWSENGIIQLSCDGRTAGHNGREGTDQLYRRLDENEVNDFVEWGRWLQSLPYVQADKIGVEGFSFGGTMTTILLLDHSDVFHYGIAGGGVYDWALYDTHYTERFMDTPQNNPEGYEATRALNHVKNYPVTFDNDNGSVMLKITHGTGDDNVHFQNTLQLIDEMMKQGKKFELMIYPDGMHGYRGYQGRYSWEDDKQFWLRNLKGVSRQ